ncbi:MAG: PepSY-associated TM helix domain-containing protein [Dechloromonas sp.]|nr:PepSY-associated TM helix domain-containing protein [Dechloromonas sp.]
MDRANPSVGSGEAILANAHPRRRSRRAVFLTWVRKIHLYVGLWGAILGLLFGVTGILLNHRAIMKLPLERSVQKTVQLALPETLPATPEELAAWLQGELKFAPQQVVQVKKQAAKTVVWADQEVMQPERWSVSLQTPQRGVMAEYFIGNRFVKLDHTDATPIGTLTRLHISVGVSAFWVLLADTIAGSLILLSITGLLLWTQLRALHTATVGTSIGALMAAIWFVWSM